MKFPTVTVSVERDEGLRLQELVLSFLFEDGREYVAASAFGSLEPRYTREQFIEKVFGDWTHCGQWRGEGP